MIVSLYKINTNQHYKWEQGQLRFMRNQCFNFKVNEAIENILLIFWTKSDFHLPSFEAMASSQRLGNITLCQNNAKWMVGWNLSVYMSQPICKIASTQTDGYWFDSTVAWISWFSIMQKNLVTYLMQWTVSSNLQKLFYISWCVLHMDRKHMVNGFSWRIITFC